jgi:hypothetical protein
VAGSKTTTTTTTTTLDHYRCGHLVDIYLHGASVSNQGAAILLIFSSTPYQPWTHFFGWFSSEKTIKIIRDKDCAVYRSVFLGRRLLAKKDSISIGNPNI